MGVKSGLSKEGTGILWCHFSKDNQAFEDIVRRAVNMEDEEKERYLDQLYHDCGINKSDIEIYTQKVIDTERGDEDEVKAIH
jgi:cytidylate kinase